MKLFLRYLVRPINLLWLALLVAAVWALGYLPVKEIWSTLQGLNPLDLGLWLAFNLFILMIFQFADHCQSSVKITLPCIFPE